MICDWQIFWHEHRKHPRLINGMQLGGGYTEYLADDGTIQRRYYESPAKMIAKAFADAMADLSTMKSPFFEAVKRSSAGQ